MGQPARWTDHRIDRTANRGSLRPAFISICSPGIATSVSHLAPFLLLLYRLQPHIKAVDHRRVELASLLPAMLEVTALLDARDKPYLRSGTRAYEGLREAITFRKVGFQYDAEGDARQALVNVSCTFRKNQVTALVGPSGAGKSTLIALRCSAVRPEPGRDPGRRRAAPEFDLASWRRGLAFAGQDLDLMGDTVGENIAYGRPGAGRDEIVAAARQAEAHDFIMALPQGYDTRVGERGLRLSTGQRQRVGIARALLRAPDVLILDEATNALDSVSEQAIQHALERIAGQMTMIVIAHRLSTVRLADRVIVLDEGRIVEQGTPGPAATRGQPVCSPLAAAGGRLC